MTHHEIFSGQAGEMHAKLAQAPMASEPHQPPHGKSIEGEDLVRRLDALGRTFPYESRGRVIVTQIALYLFRPTGFSVVIQVTGSPEDLTMEIQETIVLHFLPKALEISLMQKTKPDEFKTWLNDQISSLPETDKEQLATGIFYAVAAGLKNEGMPLSFG